MSIRTEISAGRITPDLPIVLNGFPALEKSIKDLIAGNIKIYSGPLTGIARSYWHTLSPTKYPKLSDDLRERGFAIPADQYGVPRGTIISWLAPIDFINPNSLEGSVQAPEGWAICDASTPDVPDLRHKFLFGAGTKDGVQIKPGDEGGAPTHRHTIDLRSTHSRNYPVTIAGRDTRAEQNMAHGNHLHNVTETEEDNLPPYHAIIYIMKL